MANSKNDVRNPLNPRGTFLPTQKLFLAASCTFFVAHQKEGIGQGPFGISKGGRGVPHCPTITDSRGLGVSGMPTSVNLF